MNASRDVQDKEREELISTLAHHRSFLRQTVAGISDEDAGRRTTISELCLGGLIKHVASVERGWTDFIEHGPAGMGLPDEGGIESYQAGFCMLPGETLELLLDRYAEVGRHTERLMATLPSLDASQPLPVAPWFEPGASWSARRVFLHILAETAQHAGHADIIREALDGSKTMG
jgi:Protein of unknown function (DUF664)